MVKDLENNRKEEIGLVTQSLEAHFHKDVPVMV